MLRECVAEWTGFPSDHAHCCLLGCCGAGSSCLPSIYSPNISQIKRTPVVHLPYCFSAKRHLSGISLVVQWLGICLPMQGKHFLFFCPFRSAPVAYESSHARSWIRAAAAGLCYSHISMWDPSWVCDLHQSSQQCQILNPLIKAKDWTHILMDTSRVCYHWAMTRTLRQALLTVWYISFYASGLTTGDSFSEILWSY